MTTRRHFLQAAGGGFGGIALAQLLAAEESGSDPHGGVHHRPRVRRIVQLFMNGGASQMDTFDYKPELERLHGKKFDPGDGSRIEAATSVPGNVMKSPFPFKQHGQCGRWVSSLFPHVAGCVDDIAFMMAMQSRTNVHGPGSFLMNTGFLLPGFPSLGAWVSYALGRLTDNLPSFIVLPDPRGLPYNQKGSFAAGFLPASHGATTITVRADQSKPLVNDLFPPKAAKYITPESDKASVALLQRMNRRHLADHPGDSRLEARIAGYELAAKMQLSAPEAFDLTKESKSTHELYGTGDKVTEDFGRRCLIARRLLERDVRFIQLWSGPSGPKNNWDNHGNIITELPRCTNATDRPIAALLKDLKARGMFEDTLVIWSTEFGRMPFTQGTTGRDHNGGTFVGWMAGAGVRGGVAYGESDPWSWKTAKDVTTTYDFHATVLHLLGIDHERLSVRHNGIDRRLTDVHGHVIKKVLA